MKTLNTGAIILLWVIALYCPVKSSAQEFPIAVGADTTFPGGGAFDGTNYLMGIVGDAQSKDNLTLQFISTNGTLVGSRISLGKKGGNVQIAFDGSNYLIVYNNLNWNPFNNEPYDTSSIYGQFITPAGNFTGSPFTIASGTYQKHGGTLTFNKNVYLMIYLKGGKHMSYLYGQQIAKTGSLIGAPVKISSNYARECALSFDGTNYLAAWVEGSGYPNDKVVFGQLLSNTNTLVGANFVIDGGNGLSDNPISIAFDGTRYLLAFHEQAADTISRWNLYARFISLSGIVDSVRITVCDSTNYPGFPSIGFDGTNYLLTWVNMFSPTTINAVQLKGRFFNKSGLPIDTAFKIFETMGNKFPLGGVSGFNNNQYLIGVVRLNSNFTDGDIYGKFISSSVVGIKENKIQNTAFTIYPNPASNVICLNFDKAILDDLTMNIYDGLGTLRKSACINHNELQIEIGELNNGIYFIEISSRENTFIQKLLIQR